MNNDNDPLTLGDVLNLKPGETREEATQQAQKSIYTGKQHGAR